MTFANTLCCCSDAALPRLCCGFHTIHPCLSPRSKTGHNSALRHSKFPAQRKKKREVLPQPKLACCFAKVEANDGVEQSLDESFPGLKR